MKMLTLIRDSEIGIGCAEFQVHTTFQVHTRLREHRILLQCVDILFYKMKKPQLKYHSIVSVHSSCWETEKFADFFLVTATKKISRQFR
jgi:hypothetical protein